MSLTGTVKNGVVVLDGESILADGTKVQVEPVEEPRNAPTLAERFRAVTGILEGLPADLAENHDHYLHGRPKR